MIARPTFSVDERAARELLEAIFSPDDIVEIRLGGPIFELHERGRK